MLSRTDFATVLDYFPEYQNTIVERLRDRKRQEAATNAALKAKTGAAHSGTHVKTTSFAAMASMPPSSNEFGASADAEMGIRLFPRTASGSIKIRTPGTDYAASSVSASTYGPLFPIDSADADTDAVIHESARSPVQKQRLLAAESTASSSRLRGSDAENGKTPSPSSRNLVAMSIIP